MTLHLNEHSPATSAKQVEKGEPYYKLQIRAWTAIDPTQLTLRQIAELVDSGAGVLTAVEVIKVAEGLSSVDDNEVREAFENMRAAERVLRNMKVLPAALRERLQSALRGDSRSSLAA
jgi:hypothetical protein